MNNEKTYMFKNKPITNIKVNHLGEYVEIWNIRDGIINPELFDRYINIKRIVVKGKEIWNRDDGIVDKELFDKCSNASNAIWYFDLEFLNLLTDICRNYVK